MALLVSLINDQPAWENFVLAHEPSSFLQAWNWGVLNQALGQKIFRLGIFENQKLVGVGLVIKVPARRGTFLHCPYGPLLDFENPKYLESFLDFLKKLAREEKAVFIRINPLLLKNEENRSIFQKMGFKNAPIHMINPELSWMLDLTQNEEELLKNMRKTTRYLVRRAEKDGVKIVQSDQPSDLDLFYQIHLETVKRHKFVPYSLEFLKKQFEAFKKDDQIKLFLGKYQGEILTAAIIVFYGKEASYHHAASSSQYPKIPASYLLQWEAIKEAKRRGCKIYNFWGIVENHPKHPWAGLSLFKMGFGGFKKEYLHVQDLPLCKHYYLTWLIETIRRIRRHY